MTYNFHDASSTVDDYTDSSSSKQIDNYTTANGGTLQVTHSGGYAIQVWDPNLGTVLSNSFASAPSSNLSGITWKVRTTSTFANPQLWLDEKLLNWQSGTISTAGQLTDTYSGAGITLTVVAQVGTYFATGSTSTATVTITSGGSGTGTLGQDKVFNFVGHTLQNAESNHSAPLFTGADTIYRINASNYSFTGGFQDSLGNRTDVYLSPQYGTMSVSGSVSNPYTATVKLTYGFSISSGTYYNGTFSVSSYLITLPSAQPSVYGPPAFWVRGNFYLQSTTTPTTYTSGNYSLTLSNTGSPWTLSGTDASGAFSGACSSDPVGVFLIQDASGASTVPVIPANADGTLHLDWSAAPSGMPPAVIEGGQILVYLGTATEDTNATASAAYYGSPVISGQTPWLLKLRTDGSGTATYTDYSTGVSTTGSYSSQTHLFLTSLATSGSPGFPMPVYGVDPAVNYALWSQTLPDSSTGLPATFLVNGEVWRYSGTGSNGNAIYQGYYTDPNLGTQQLTVSTPDPVTNLRTVTMTDPIEGSGTPVQGILSSVRGSARLSDGSEVYSGSFSGQQINPSLNPNLYSIASDLDITGNIVTFGSLSTGSATAGATLQFQDATIGGSLTATLYSLLARPQAQWLWSRADASNNLQSPLPAMKLDTSSKLTLYDTTAGNAGVILDPTPDGTSSIRGVLRVRPGGDIDMGEFTTSPTGSPP